MPSAATVSAYPDSGSFRSLSRFPNDRGAIGRFATEHSWGDYVRQFDDFTENAINTTRWTTNAGSGGTAFATPGTLVTDGVITGATGTDGTLSNRMVNIYGARIWKGVQNCWTEICFTSTRVSDMYFEFGFIDTQTTITTPSQVCTDTDLATHTFNAGTGDAAIVARDSAQTLTTSVLATLGSSPVSNTGLTAAIGTYVPTITVKNRIRVALTGNTVNVWADRSDSNGFSLAAAGAINGATLLRPWFFIGGGTATTCSVSIDYWYCGQDRS